MPDVTSMHELIMENLGTKLPPGIFYMNMEMRIVAHALYLACFKQRSYAKMCMFQSAPLLMETAEYLIDFAVINWDFKDY